MRDYEELIKSLRICADSADPISECCFSDCCEHDEPIDPLCMGQLIHMAADAIEELSKPKWISVEERLPESGTHVLVCCRVKWLGGEGHSYVCDAFHSNPKTIVCSYDDDIDSEYDEETDEYYFPEGWWEVIKNWDDYSCVAIEDTVTHWMPLPSTDGLNET